MDNKHKKNIAVILGFACVLVLVFIIVGYAWYESFPNMTKRNAESLISALEAYKRDNGDYPTSINMLVPDYINSIPRNTFGGRFTYAMCEKENLYILFTSRSFLIFYSVSWGYSSETQQWKSKEGSFPVYLGEYPCLGF